MTKRQLRNTIIAFIPIIIGVGVSLYFSKDISYDVYLFYDHERYLDNIFYDVSNLATYTVFSYFAMKYDRKVFTPFFILSLIEIPAYFLFYKQFLFAYSLPTLILLILIYNFREK